MLEHILKEKVSTIVTHHKWKHYNLFVHADVLRLLQSYIVFTGYHWWCIVFTVDFEILIDCVSWYNRHGINMGYEPLQRDSMGLTWDQHFNMGLIQEKMIHLNIST